MSPWLNPLRFSEHASDRADHIFSHKRQPCQDFRLLIQHNLNGVLMVHSVKSKILKLIDKNNIRFYLLINLVPLDKCFGVGWQGI